MITIVTLISWLIVGLIGSIYMFFETHRSQKCITLGEIIFILIMALAGYALGIIGFCMWIGERKFWDKVVFCRK